MALIHPPSEEESVTAAGEQERPAGGDDGGQGDATAVGREAASLAVGVLLDLGGLLPGGAAFDALAALRHARRGEHLLAVLSLASAIPALGSITGTGKLALWLVEWGGRAHRVVGAGRGIAPALARLRRALWRHRSGVLALLERAAGDGRLAPHAGGMRRALEAFLREAPPPPRRDRERKLVLRHRGGGHPPGGQDT